MYLKNPEEAGGVMNHILEDGQLFLGRCGWSPSRSSAKGRALDQLTPGTSQPSILEALVQKSKLQILSIKLIYFTYVTTTHFQHPRKFTCFQSITFLSTPR